jgi:hypothetical protein
LAQVKDTALTVISQHIRLDENRLRLREPAVAPYDDMFAKLGPAEKSIESAARCQKLTSRHCTNKKPFVRGKEPKTNRGNLTVSVKELGDRVQPHPPWERDVSAPGSL